jgi:large subunit ribosomal protein L15
MEEQERIGLHNLSPTPGSTKERKRVGRGQGSGTGKTSGRGQKGQKSRSGSHMMRAGFIGGQMPLHMQVPKLRGAHSKDAMPVGPFRTFTHGVNVSSLAARFEAGAEVTPETMLAARVLRTLRHPVKILGDGEITVALTVHAHRFSASARQKIEAAGGTVVLIDPVEEPEAPVRDEVKRAASEARAAAAAKAPKKKKASDDDDDVAADADAGADAEDQREEAKKAAAEARAAAAEKKQSAEDEAQVTEEPAAESAAEEPVAESDEPAADEAPGDDEA